MNAKKTRRSKPKPDKGLLSLDFPEITLDFPEIEPLDLSVFDEPIELDLSELEVDVDRDALRALSKAAVNRVYIELEAALPHTPFMVEAKRKVLGLVKSFKALAQGKP
ncbi:unnamed protein product [marine sediment metagenome]|uniref:Uncharacterized protein n=2 Tax=marine sediment metagenome TaxID=412755 RepID=X1JAN1_9ZZZZ